MQNANAIINQTSSQVKDILFREEIYKIVGAAMEVHRQLGCGFLESVYQEALAHEFSLQKIPFQAQSPITIHYKDLVLQKYFVADFVLYDQIILEIKAVECIDSNAISQVINYLKGTGIKLGLLINFGGKNLEWKRIAFTKK